MSAYWAGNVSLANAVGTGIADDKAIYAYMPQIIRYYLGEDPLLPNVETRLPAQGGLAYTLAHIKDLVIKPVSASVVMASSSDRSRHTASWRPARQSAREPAKFHQPVSGQFVSVPNPDQSPHRTAARRFETFCNQRQFDLGSSRRVDPRRIAQGFVSGQLVTRWRIEGYVGP